LLFEPLPAGTKPGVATRCQWWLIDHGACGLWPGSKFGRGPEDLPPAAAVDGTMVEPAETSLAIQMPSEYRMALKNCEGEAREELLQQISQVQDHVIHAAIDEVPDGYITKQQADATAAFLKDRRDALDGILEKYWTR
jgi:hypothetical protein